MTTRKALIERIQSMQLGTQEMLDAAKDDARLIPFDTLFVAKDTLGPVWRIADGIDDNFSVFMPGSQKLFYSAEDLLPAEEE